MRALLALCLALAACSADPVLLPDAGPADTGAPVDAGATDAGAQLDAQLDAPTTLDAQPDVVDVPAALDVLPDGCVSTTEGNCCGVACPAPANGTPACVAGACGLGACAPGFGDCNGNPADGCEVEFATSAAHCGGCRAACAAGRVCIASSCVACLPGSSVCGDDCRDLRTDPSNCGACGNACPDRAGATTTCVNGSCGFACNTGFADCNPADGCETNTQVDPARCGACSVRCSYPSAEATCIAGACAIRACVPGFANCDGIDANGCEANTLNNVDNCGVGGPGGAVGCGNVCPRTAGTASCTNGVCGLTCNAGFGDCDGVASNGCETNTNTTVAHCGACDRRCTIPNGTAGCAAGACTVGTCAAGYRNCNNVVADGCERRTALCI